MYTVISAQVKGGSPWSPSLVKKDKEGVGRLRCYPGWGPKSKQIFLTEAMAGHVFCLTTLDCYILGNKDYKDTPHEKMKEQ